jgi:hypothetical protein
VKLLKLVKGQDYRRKLKNIISMHPVMIRASGIEDGLGETAPHGEKFVE